MNAKVGIAVVILTRNEEHQVAACLNSVLWADEIIVVDDCSSDMTVEIAEKLNARVIVNARTGFDEQRNIGMRATTYDWILHLDADERVTLCLRDEILGLIAEAKYDGFHLPYDNYWMNHPVRHGGWGTFKPIRLARRTKSIWSGRIHEKLIVDGLVGSLQNPIVHLVDSSYQARLKKSNLYTTMTAEERYRNGAKFSMYRLVAEPVLRFLHIFIWMQGWRDGMIGFIWALHVFIGHIIIHIKLWELTNCSDNEIHS